MLRQITQSAVARQWAECIQSQPSSLMRQAFIALADRFALGEDAKDKASVFTPRLLSCRYNSVEGLRRLAH